MFSESPFASNLTQEEFDIEKLLILRSIPIFAETPEHILSEIVPILEQEFVEAGDVIFEKGTIGNSMYIIYSGEIRIHDGDHTFAMLNNREIFGELALLDTEKRSATATAVKKTLILKINQDAFYGIIAHRIEVIRSILRILCNRLRSQNGLVINLKGQINWLFAKLTKN